MRVSLCAASISPHPEQAPRWARVEGHDTPIQAGRTLGGTAMTSHYKIRTLNNHALHPETLMMGYGYSPALSEGSLKPPIFLTSTFVFESAQQGKDLFDVTAGRRQPRPGEKTGLVYSRFNNP